jgi:hypothetical protein
MSAHNRYTPAQQELRDIAFAASSSSIVGARYVDGWSPLDSRPGTAIAQREFYLPVNTIASMAAAHLENDDAGWVSVPSARNIRRRERAAQRRKMREAESGSWLGRSEEGIVPFAGKAINDNRVSHTDWVLRKDGSHDLVSW